MIQGEKLKNRLENLERLAQQATSLKSGSSLPQNDFGYQINNEWHSLPVEEDLEINCSQVPTSNFSEQPDPFAFAQQAVGDRSTLEDPPRSIIFDSAEETVSLSVYDDAFWISADSSFTVPELAEITNPVIDIASPEIQSDDLLDSLTTDAKQEASTETLRNDGALNGQVLNSRDQLKSTISKALDISLQRSPPTHFSKPTVSKFLQPYQDTRKSISAGLSSIDKKMLSKELIQYLRLDDTKENQCLVSTAIARGHNIRDIFLSGLQALGDKDQGSLLPDVYRNKLTLVRTSTLNAYLTVASAAGIHIPDLYLESTLSPFYKANATPSEVESLKQIHTSHMPPDLRPSASQILYPHKPWLDLLPFPTLRERALTLASMEPPLINLGELKSDIFLNNGLFCWQASGKGSGHPWDRRSWEAEEWFLKKWWILIGGEEADVVYQTRWWREIRGERKLELG